MANKRGLSDVVTNVLIILFVVIAVGMLWYFVAPLFTKTGEKIQMQEACISISIAPSKCLSSGVDANVTVKRNPGSGDIAELKLIFEMPDGQTEVRTMTDTPGELETRVYAVTALKSNPKKLSVAPGLADANGKITYCSESAKIEC